MAREYETEDGVRIAPLSALSDFEVAEGYPDIRGWRVDSADGQHVGKVHDLLIDIDQMRTRYLDVRLAREIAASPGDRDVLVPVGTAQLVDGSDVVRLPLTAERVGLLPLYDHGPLTRVHELEVRRHFSLGEAAAAAATGAAVGAGKRDFYEDEGYDDRRFFGARRRPLSDDELAARRAAADRDVAARDVADRELAERDIRMREGEIRVPVEKEESVVLKRGEGGHDEIIIRRPLDERDRAR
jgi:photosynthetic reaction center H subunit